MSTINLDGGEISIIRALGLSGAPMLGRDLKARVGRMSDNALAENLEMMIAVGYITSTPEMKDPKELDKIAFAVNSGYAKALREAMEPEAKPTKRVRRQ